jgi:CheY-like chemotaxis protein
MEDEDKRKFLDIICQSSSQLLSIINDIVNIATIEAGQEKIHLKTIRVNSVLSNLNEQFMLKAQEQSLELHCNQALPDDLAIIESDETKLIQIMSNLLNNAFKFTEKGGIYFGYEQKNGSLEFFVKDTGIGIPENSREKIFNRFFQIDSNLSRKAGGTGLGLSLSKAYVELLGSEIHLDSLLGKGSRFYFRIDYKNLTEEFEPDVVQVMDNYSLNDRPKSILVAEDEDNNFMLLKYILADYNTLVTRVSDGVEAVEKFKTGMHFDLIIMDIKMPRMDGIEATRIIREINPAIPVVALTAYAQETDKQKIMRSGFIDYISKPFEKSNFLLIIGKYIQISKRSN